MDRKSQCSWVKNFRLAHPYGGLLGCAFYRGCREPFASAPPLPPSTTRSAKKSTPRNVNIKGDGRRWSGRDKERRTDGGSVVSLWYSETVSSLEVWTTMNLHFNTKVSYWSESTIVCLPMQYAKCWYWQHKQHSALRLDFYHVWAAKIKEASFYKMQHNN